MSPVVQMTMNGAVATITIDRPPVNALTAEHWIELRRQIEESSRETSVRVLIIGGGPGRFCAGADITTLVEPSDEPATMLHVVADAARAIRTHRAPVIASIDGPAHGGGLELALACDLRVASPKATFSASGVNMGLVASVRSLAATVGPTHARTMLLTGARIDAATADRWALVSHFDEQPDQRANELAEDLSAKAPLAIEAAKDALGAIDTLSVDDHDALMTRLFTTLVQSADHEEAITAFLEKRRPEFRRR